MQSYNPDLTSWVPGSTQGNTDFPIQNLPFGVFAPKEAGLSQRVGVAIGDYVLDVSKVAEKGMFDDSAQRAATACGKTTLNALMGLGAANVRALRERLAELLSPDASKTERVACEKALAPIDDVELRMPVDIGDYTDFYASIYHATNVGSMFRPDNPLLPNYRHVPIGYHGRASSVVLTGTPVRRPNGQTFDDDAGRPVFGPSRLLDYEFEMGWFVGAGNPSGKSIPIQNARDHIFGMCIVNDWSARDMQKWEYQPLGPFLAKSFCTTISPWVVTLDALAPFSRPAFERGVDDPRPLPYLSNRDDHESGGFDITLETQICTRQMRERGLEPMRVSRGSFKDMYWTIAQMLTHHASNGCNLRPGDMMASGTVSGTEKASRGCLLELTWRGTDPISLPTGEERRFLQDGDEVIMRAWCERDGAVRIGFGECRGEVVAAQTV